MKLIQATIAAALVAAASAGAVRRDTENSVHVRVVKCYGDLDDSGEGEPYAWASIDDSWAPGSSKDVESAVGSKKGDIWTFPCSALTWTSIEDWEDQEVKFAIYGKDALRPDDDLGDADFDLDDVKGLKADCRPVPHTLTVENELFGDDGKCDLEVAVCDKGSMPKEFQLYTGKQCTKNKAK